VKVAGDGRIVVSAAHGVQVLAPDGYVLDEIPLPGAVNFALDGDVLFITTDTAVWSAEL
jgi:sugar lactone lactonase YvrE